MTITHRIIIYVMCRRGLHCYAELFIQT